jgi:hypothetical protein
VDDVGGGELKVEELSSSRRGVDHTMVEEDADLMGNLGTIE